MKDIFYLELREKIKEIEAIRHEQSQAENTQCDNNLLSVINLLIDISNVSRREGLLALEETVHHSAHAPGAKYFTPMIMQIVDGMEPELVEDINLTKYFSGNLKADDGLIFLMYLKGVLSLQSGENPRILEQKLKAMVPENVVSAYEEEQQRENTRKIR